jgi:hypothetical protein
MSNKQLIRALGISMLIAGIGYIWYYYNALYCDAHGYGDECDDEAHPIIGDKENAEDCEYESQGVTWPDKYEETECYDFWHSVINFHRTGFIPTVLICTGVGLGTGICIRLTFNFMRRSERIHIDDGTAVDIAEAEYAQRGPPILTVGEGPPILVVGAANSTNTGTAVAAVHGGKAGEEEPAIAPIAVAELVTATRYSRLEEFIAP